MSRLVYFLYDIVPYQESTPLQLCRTAAAVVGNTTYYVGSQMTDSRQHAESTTLQPGRTAAAVGNTIYRKLHKITHPHNIPHPPQNTTPRW